MEVLIVEHIWKDGQHRVKGIKEAYANNPTIGEEDISLIFVVHNDQNKERTRRLFTVLNKNN